MTTAKPLSQRALAAALQISQPMVSRLAARGMPTDNVDAAVAWRDRHLDPSLRKEIRRPDLLDETKVRGKLRRKRRYGTEDPLPAPRNWRERRDQVAVDKAEHELAVDRGQYVPRMVVMATWANLIGSFRSRMLAILRKLAPILANTNAPAKCEQILEEEVYAALTEISGNGIPPQSEKA